MIGSSDSMAVLGRPFLMASSTAFQAASREAPKTREVWKLRARTRPATDRFINACSIQPDYWTEEKACLLSLLPWAITKYVAPFQAWILQSSTFFPLEVMSRGVDDGDDGDEIAFHAVHNPIRKAWRQKPADIPATLADAVNQGVG